MSETTDHLEKVRDAIRQLEQEEGFPFEERAVPIQIFQDPQSREIVKQADLIYAWDTHSKLPLLFYGERRLGDIAAGRHDGRSQGMVVIAIDARADQLEYLYAAVEVLKGSCCYRGGED